MKSIMLAVSLLLLFAFSPKRACAVEGVDLYQKCLAFDRPQPTETDVRDVQFCGGYIMAAYEFIDFEDHRMTSDGKRVAPFGFCFPDHIGSRELILVYMKYVKEHPTLLHQFAALGVVNAFGDAYPCKK